MEEQKNTNKKIFEAVPSSGYKFKVSPSVKSILIAIALLIITSTALVNAIPDSLNLIGRVTDNTGSPLVGNYNFSFRIYNNYTAGTKLFELNTNLTTTSNGVYDVILQGLNLNFSDQYYLGIAVFNDGEINSRINLTSSPYSFRANTSEALNPANTYKVSTLNVSSGAFIQALNVSGQTLLATSSGNVGIGTTSNPTYKLVVDDTTTASLNVSDTLFVDGSSKYVGIGEIAPARKLHVKAAAETFYFERTSTETNTIQTIGQLVHITTDDMADGFGAELVFRIADPGYANTPAKISGIRDGSDGEGAMVFKAGTSGSEEFMRISSSGNVGINTSSPSEKLDVVGNARISGLMNASNITSQTLFEVSTQNLVLAMNLNNESLIYGNTNLSLDTSPFSNHGTIIGSPLYLPYKGFNGGGTFNFSNNMYIKVNSDNSLILDGNFSINVWYNRLVTQQGNVISKASGAAASNTEYLLTPQDSTNFFYFRGAWNSPAADVLTDAAVLNKWIMITVTYDTGSGKISWYLDGKARGTTTNAGAYATTTTGGFYLGKQGDASANNFMGYIDDARIYKNRILTPTEVYNLYAQKAEIPMPMVSQKKIFTDVNGNVGIGTTSPTILTHINSASDTDILRLQDSDGTCDHNPESSSETVTCSSDRKLKTNIEDADSAIRKFEKIKIRKYDVIVSGNERVGVIAQEIQQTNPDMVHDVDGTLFVEQPNPWELLKAIQELQQDVDSIKGGRRSSIAIDNTPDLIAETNSTNQTAIITANITASQFTEIQTLLSQYTERINNLEEKITEIESRQRYVNGSLVIRI